MSKVPVLFAFVTLFILIGGCTVHEATSDVMFAFGMFLGFVGVFLLGFTLGEINQAEVWKDKGKGAK